MTDENNRTKFFLYENWARTRTGQHTVQMVIHLIYAIEGFIGSSPEADTVGIHDPDRFFTDPKIIRYSAGIQKKKKKILHDAMACVVNSCLHF